MKKKAKRTPKLDPNFRQCDGLRIPAFVHHPKPSLPNPPKRIKPLPGQREFPSRVR